MTPESPPRAPLLVEATAPQAAINGRTWGRTWGRTRFDERPDSIISEFPRVTVQWL